MECAVCNKEMTEVHVDTENGVIYASLDECRHCGMYADEFAYGNSRVFIQGVEYPCGDPRTIEGSRLAWDVWFAIVKAREALRREAKN